ncbi:hypothetical protein HOY82DRAFT_670374 [Tuber indicum]|nr:hypothetical protein HOY82DRAFT_670374 [Tuber indicum]
MSNPNPVAPAQACTHTALLLIIGILVPLSLLAIWVLFRDRKTKSPLGGLSNDPEHQVGEHQPTAYPLRLVSPSPPPPPSPSRPGSAIIPPPVAHRNGRNKQPPRTKTHNTSSLTSTGARSTAPAKTGEGAEILSHLPIYVKLKRDKLLQHRHEEGKANGMRAGREE